MAGSAKGRVREGDANIFKSYPWEMKGVRPDWQNEVVAASLVELYNVENFRRKK
jgi:hypothetical protein